MGKKRNVADVQLVMPFALKKRFEWWRMRRGLSTQALMRGNAFAVISVLKCAR